MLAVLCLLAATMTSLHLHTCGQSEALEEGARTGLRAREGASEVSTERQRERESKGSAERESKGSAERASKGSAERERARAAMRESCYWLVRTYLPTRYL
jgi:hypothetical protein